MCCQSRKSLNNNGQNESIKPTPFPTLPSHLDQKQMSTIRHKMDKLFTHSTFSKLSLLTVIGWSTLGSMLTARFLHMHNSEPSSDFRCNVKDNVDKDYVRVKCFDQYQKQNNKLGVPLYAFIMVNVWFIPFVSVIYSLWKFLDLRPQMLKTTSRDFLKISREQRRKFGNTSNPTQISFHCATSQ